MQHQLRRYAYYDISAGGGLLAPACYNFEQPSIRQPLECGRAGYRSLLFRAIRLAPSQRKKGYPGRSSPFLISSAAIKQ
jgi:hypothetical protein